MASDNDDDKDDDDGNDKDAEVVEISTGEAITMLDRLVNLKYLSKDERNSLVSMKDKLEKVRVQITKSKPVSMIILCREISIFYVRIKLV